MIVQHVYAERGDRGPVIPGHLSLSLSFFLSLSLSLSLSLLYIIFLIFFFIDAVCCLTIVLFRLFELLSQHVAHSTERHVEAVWKSLSVCGRRSVTLSRFTAPTQPVS